MLVVLVVAALSKSTVLDSLKEMNALSSTGVPHSTGTRTV